LLAVVLAGLLGGTAAALALTEQLKLERSPVLRTNVGKLLGRHGSVKIDFVLRKPERLSVAVVDSDGHVVRTLLQSGSRARGLQRFRWDGRDSAGNEVPTGTYRPRLHLGRAHRTILMPNPIRVDPTPPSISLVWLKPKPRRFSPDGDFRLDNVYVRYRASERARALLFVNGKKRVELRPYAESGLIRWRGKTFGRALPAGRYRLTLRARDLAGNLSAPVPIGVVRIRYVTVRPHIRRVQSGGRMRFRVTTDAKRFDWRFGKSGRGRSRPGVLVLRAPSLGLYRLVVTANGHSARAIAIVEAAP
jgi:flagellar hook capping protein FlgD